MCRDTTETETAEAMQLAPVCSAMWCMLDAGLVEHKSISTQVDQRGWAHIGHFILWSSMPRDCLSRPPPDPGYTTDSKTKFNCEAPPTGYSVFD